MANFVHLRRVHVSSRLTKSRRNFNAAATDFRTQQHLLVKSHVLNADYAVKALGQGLKPEGQSAKRTAGGVTAEKKPEIRFDPKATKKPGQVFKMNITGADMLRDGDEPNWGWVDPPKPVTDEDRNETYQKFARRPKIRIREFDVDPRTGGPRFDTGVQVKALGDKIGGGASSLGGRAASSMGLIVDALGKFRCPPGTPAANQFTDEFGSNCFSPLAVLRSGLQSLTEALTRSDGGIFRRLRGESLEKQRRHAAVQAATSSVKTPLQTGERQKEILAAVEELKEELGIDSSEGRKLKNLDLYEVFDRLAEAGWKGSWKDRVTDIYGTPIVPLDGETTEEFVERIDGVLTENFLSLAEALELGYGYGRHGTVSDEFRARYESGEEGIVVAVAIMREKRYANHRGAMMSFVTMYKEDPSKFDNFAGFGTRLFGGPTGPSTNAMALPDVRDNAKPGDTIFLINDLAAIANEYWQFRGDKISQVMVDGMHTEAEKMQYIRDFLQTQREGAPWLVHYSEFYAMDVAKGSVWDPETQTLAEGIRAAHTARGMQLGFHEFTHVEQNALVQKRVVDKALEDGELWIHGVPEMGIPARDKPLLVHDPSNKKYLPNEPFSHWSNDDWADAIGSAMLDPETLGAIKDGDIPPRDIHEFEGSMLHHLAGEYYQGLVEDWHSGTLEPGSAEARHLQLMLIEGTAELNAQRKMGLIGGDRIEEMLSYLDVTRDPIPRYRNPIDTQGVLDGADETPGMPGIEPMPLEDPTGSWDRLSKRIESMHKRGVGPRGDAREMRSLIHNEFDYTDEALYNIGADVMDSRYVDLSAEVDALYDKYLDGGLNKDEQARLFLASRGMEQIINENARRIRASDEQRAERLFLGKEVNPGKHVPDTMPPYVMEDLDLDAHDPVDTSVFSHRDIVEEIYPKLGSEDNLTPAARAIMPPSMSETEATLSTHTATRREVVDGGLTDVQKAAVSADLETKHGDVFLNPDELGQAIRQSAAAKRYADDHGIPLEDPSPDTPSPHIDREIDQVIAPAMRAIDDNPLTDPITVRTTLSGEELAEFTSMEVGRVVSANTFTTGVVASHDQNDMADGLPGSGTIRIEMPEGTKALFKDHPTDGSNNGVLLPPGDFKIKSIEDGGDIVLELVSQKTTDDVLSDIEGVLDDLPAPASRAEGRERRNLRNVLTKNREEARLESEKITEPAFEYDNPIDMPPNLVVEEYNALQDRVDALTETEQLRSDDLAQFIRFNETGSVDVPDPDSDFVTTGRGLASITPRRNANGEVMNREEIAAADNLDPIESSTGGNGPKLRPPARDYGERYHLVPQGGRTTGSVQRPVEANRDGHWIEVSYGMAYKPYDRDTKREMEALQDRLNWLRIYEGDRDDIDTELREIRQRITDIASTKLLREPPLSQVDRHTVPAAERTADTLKEFEAIRDVRKAAVAGLDARLAAGEIDQKTYDAELAKLPMSRSNPIITSNPDVAIQVLLEGGMDNPSDWMYVQMKTTGQYSIMVDRFKEKIRSGEIGRDKKFDLCKVTVPGTSLFCVASDEKKFRRLMPQLGGKARPGTRAHARWVEKANQKGEKAKAAALALDPTDLVAAEAAATAAFNAEMGDETKVIDEFLDLCKKLNIKLTGTFKDPEMRDVDAAMHATQTELDGQKVLGMATAGRRAEELRELNDRLLIWKLDKGEIDQAEFDEKFSTSTMAPDVTDKAAREAKLRGMSPLDPDEYEKVTTTPDPKTLGRDGKPIALVGNADGQDNAFWHPAAKAILISKDGHIIDGHHRWAAQHAMDVSEEGEDIGAGVGREFPVVIVDVTITEALALSTAYADAEGMSRKAANPDEAAPMPDAYIKAYAEAGGAMLEDGITPDFGENPDGTSAAEIAGQNALDMELETVKDNLRQPATEVRGLASRSEADRVAAWNEARTTSGIRDVSRERATRVREVEKELQGYESQLRGKMFAMETAKKKGDTEKVAELQKEFDHLASQERHFRGELRGLKSTGQKSSRRSADPSRRATMQNKVNERTAVRKQHGVGGKTGDIFDHDDGYVEEARALVETQFQLGPLVSGDNHHNWLIDTRENKVRRAREAASGGITRLREGRVLSESHLRSDDLLESIGHARRGDVPVPPAVAKFLAESTDEEVMAKLDEAVQTFVSDFDPRIRVTARPERIDEIFADSDRRYKTTHEVRSAHSTAGSRRTLEQMWGIPYDAPSEVRPASGYLEHKQFRQQKAAWIAARQKREPHRLRFGQTDPDFLPEYTGTLTPSGILGLVYGGDHAGGSISFVLRADRANDSGMIFGDSALQGAKRPTKITSTNSDDLLAAILHPEEMVGSHAERNAQENRLQIMSFLNGSLTGDWSGATDPGVHVVAQAKGISAMEKADTADRYVEALVPGGFDLDEVDHVSFPVSMLDTGNRDLTDVDIGRNHPDVQEALSAYNLSDTELDQLFSEIRDLLPGKSTVYMKEHLAASEKRAELKKVGLDTIFQNDDAIDIFDPKAWLSLPPNVWGDKPPSADSNVYELLQHLIRVSIIKHASRMVQQQRKPTRVSERVLTGSVV